MNINSNYKAWSLEHRVMVDILALDFENNLLKCAINNFSPRWEAMDNFIILKPVGLSDKNGKEVREGDIDSDGFVVTYLADLHFGLGMNAGWYLQRDDFESWTELECSEDLEIIGNIFETPEKAINNNRTDYVSQILGFSPKIDKGGDSKSLKNSSSFSKSMSNVKIYTALQMFNLSWRDYTGRAKLNLDQCIYNIDSSIFGADFSPNEPLDNLLEKYLKLACNELALDYSESSHFVNTYCTKVAEIRLADLGICPYNYYNEEFNELENLTKYKSEHYDITSQYVKDRSGYVS